jgi:hypothetical protein
MLREAEELTDGPGEALAALLLTSARLVDEVTGPDSIEPGYARAAVVRAYLGVIVELRKATATPMDDGWTELLQVAASSSQAG